MEFYFGNLRLRMIFYRQFKNNRMKGAKIGCEICKNKWKCEKK